VQGDPVGLSEAMGVIGPVLIVLPLSSHVFDWLPHGDYLPWQPARWPTLRFTGVKANSRSRQRVSYHWFKPLPSQLPRPSDWNADAALSRGLRGGSSGEPPSPLPATTRAGLSLYGSMQPGDSDCGCFGLGDTEDALRADGVNTSGRQLGVPATHRSRKDAWRRGGSAAGVWLR